MSWVNEATTIHIQAADSDEMVKRPTLVFFDDTVTTAMAAFMVTGLAMCQGMEAGLIDDESV